MLKEIYAGGTFISFWRMGQAENMDTKVQRVGDCAVKD